MKTIEKDIPIQKTTHFDELLSDPCQVLFFDIETTGLSPKGASIYLIGCSFYTKAGWRCRQYFAETPAEEGEILRAFCSFAKTFSCFWNFNGSTFDLPFIQAKCKKHAIPSFMPEENCDIYRHIRPFKNLLHLSGCRQKQLEEYIGLYRKDQFSGGELIELYKIYGETRDENLLAVLLLHNFEDIQGMLEVSRIMAVPGLFQEHHFIVEKAELLSAVDTKGFSRKELQITLLLTAPLPVPLSCHSTDSSIGCCYFSCRDSKAILKIPVFTGELKLFYKDYKNYSYLPEEDQAMHKSVAVYVDKSRRMPATAATCYTRTSGNFLPYYKGSAADSKEHTADLPLFYPSYKAKEVYLYANEKFLSDPDMLHAYAAAVLDQF